jgi:hypothetical protein
METSGVFSWNELPPMKNPHASASATNPIIAVHRPYNRLEFHHKPCHETSHTVRAASGRSKPTDPCRQELRTTRCTEVRIGHHAARPRGALLATRTRNPTPGRHRVACPRRAMIRYLGWHVQRLCDGRGLRWGALPSDQHPTGINPRRDGDRGAVACSLASSVRWGQAPSKRKPSGWRRAEPCNVCRSSTRQLAPLGYDCEAIAAYWIRARAQQKRPHGAFASVIQPTYQHPVVSGLRFCWPSRNGCSCCGSRAGV